MANAVMTVQVLKGYTTVFGSRGASVCKLTWNAAQYIAGGFTFSKQSVGLRGIDFMDAGGVTAGGNYIAQAQIVSPGGGSATAKIRLIVLSTGLEVAGGAALTADSTLALVIGG